MNTKDLEDRLIKFTVAISKSVKACRSLDGFPHLKNQILRSSSSAALNFGEAQCAESKKDFIHKTKIILKELKETHINLRIMMDLVPKSQQAVFVKLLNDNDELNAIFYSTLKTAVKNQKPTG